MISCRMTVACAAVPAGDLPTEQQITSRFQDAAKKKKKRACADGAAPAAAGTSKRLCKHCKGPGHDIRTCPHRSLASEDARRLAASTAAVGGADAAGNAAPDAAAGAAGAAAAVDLEGSDTDSGASVPVAKRKRAPTRCKHCGQLGHNVRTCAHRDVSSAEAYAKAAAAVNGVQPPSAPR